MLAIFSRDLADFQIAIGKTGVRKPVTKREERLGAVVLVTAIANEDSLLVNHALSVRFGIVAVVRGIVFVNSVKGGGAGAGRGGRAKSDSRQGLPGVLAPDPGPEGRGARGEPMD